MYQPRVGIERMVRAFPAGHTHSVANLGFHTDHHITAGEILVSERIVHSDALCQKYDCVVSGTKTDAAEAALIRSESTPRSVQGG